MKTLNKSLLVLVLVLMTTLLNAQTINWASLKKENKHVLSANLGIEHGVVYGVGYGYQVKNNWFPAIVNIEYSFPSGNKLVDDYKTKIGGKIRWIKSSNFQFSTNLHGVFRTYENDFVKMLNFGSDLSGVAGIYKPKWFAAAEFGFDKAIVTHFRHSSMYKNQYAAVADGWYEPATGGNFYYGLQAGYSFNNSDITLKAGKMASQDFKTQLVLPFYVQLGYNIKL